VIDFHQDRLHLLAIPFFAASLRSDTATESRLFEGIPETILQASRASGDIASFQAPGPESQQFENEFSLSGLEVLHGVIPELLPYMRCTFFLRRPFPS
jgi:hypothetical protein